MLPLWDSVVVLCFVVRLCPSNTSFAIILMRKRDMVALLLFVFLVSLGRCVALTHGATGLSAVCGSYIS